VAAKSPEACGTLALGWLAKSSTRRTSRLLRRLSPKAAYCSSLAAHPFIITPVFSYLFVENTHALLSNSFAE
jgi:hypothetical protein